MKKKPTHRKSTQPTRRQKVGIDRRGQKVAAPAGHSQDTIDALAESIARLVFARMTPDAASPVLPVNVNRDEAMTSCQVAARPSPTVTGPAHRETIEEALSSVQSALEASHETVTLLEKVLGPVLRPESETDGCGKLNQTEPQPASLVMSLIGQHETVARTLTRRLLVIIERIDLR